MSESVQGTRADRTFFVRIQAFLTGLSQRQAAGLVLLVYLLLAVLMTWPVITELGIAIPSNRHGDQWEHQWTFWWIKESLSDGNNPFYTTQLFYPTGVSLTSHNIAWLNAALWLPLQAVVGSFAAVSLIYIGLFALNGLSMYLLVRELIGSRPAAFIGGLIFSFWPYLLSQAGHPNMIVVFWLPLALLFLERTLVKGRVHDAVLTGVFIAVGGIARWQLFFIGGMLFGFFLLYRLLTDRSTRTKRSLGLLFLTGLVSLLLMAPFALPVVASQITRTQAQVEELYRSLDRPADALAYIVPSQTLTIWRSIVGNLPERLQFNYDQMEFLGFTTLALAFYGSLKKWKTARFWIFIAVFYILLALGPTLRAGGVHYPKVPLPYRLVGELFFIRIQRAPHRFNAFLSLPMAMLAALGVAALLQRARAVTFHQTFLRARGPHPNPSPKTERGQGRGLSTAIVLVLAVLILAEYTQVPYPTARASLPAWYQRLAKEPGDFAVLVLPMNQKIRNKWYMEYQTRHGKALVQGEISRVPSEARAFIDASPFLARLREDNTMDPELVDVTQQLRPLAEVDVRYLILDKQFTEASQLELWRGWLAFEPTYEDEELVVYRTDPKLGQDFEISHDMGDHLGLIQTGYGPRNLMQGDLLWVNIGWTSDGRPAGDYQACVTLLKDSGEVVRSDCETLPLAWPTSNWDVDEIVRGDTILQPGPFVDPGTYSLALSLVDADSGDKVGQTLNLGSVEIEALPRIYETPDLAHRIDARWGEKIALPGFYLEESDDSLSLTVYWQALERLSSSYKVFTHLINQSTGELVAQMDSVPREWRYPTNWWDRGEVISDTINLPVADLPPGQYRLQVGFYDPETGERLTATTAEGQPYPENAVTLTILER